MSLKQKQYSILFVILLIISYFSFFDDYFKYLEVKKNGTSAACSSYYLDFPNGYFTEDVKVIEIKDSRDIVLVRAFISDYPSSDYLSIVKLINLEIWNDEISRYNSILRSLSNTSNSILDKSAVDFFSTLLHYMRDQNKSTIYVNLSGLVNLKDFEDYNKEIRSSIDELTLSFANRKASGNIANCSNNYSRGNMEVYEEIIIASIDSSFENILSDNFILIESVNKISNTASNELLINIDYEIKNQDMGEYGFPEMPYIWEYYDMESNNFISYLLGVSIFFDFDFSIPNSRKKYTFRYDSNPLSNIENITSLESGYKEMTKQNFEDFSNTIANNFGIY